MTARNLSNPQRKPATQSRPMATAGGVDSRQVGSSAGGRRTAAAFSSFGAAACNSILARDRHRDNGEVRRLGFAPIPGRRFNSACHRRLSPTERPKGPSPHDRTIEHPSAQLEINRKWGDKKYLRAAQSREVGKAREKTSEAGGSPSCPLRNPKISAVERSACLQGARLDESVTIINSNPGAFRGERAARKIIDAQKLEISRDRKPGQKRVGALPGSCASLRRGTARQSRAGVMTGCARNLFRIGEFVAMGRVGNDGIGDARKNIGGVKCSS